MYPATIKSDMNLNLKKKIGFTQYGSYLLMREIKVLDVKCGFSVGAWSVAIKHLVVQRRFFLFAKNTFLESLNCLESNLKGKNVDRNSCTNRTLKLS